MRGQARVERHPGPPVATVWDRTVWEAGGLVPIKLDSQERDEAGRGEAPRHLRLQRELAEPRVRLTPASAYSSG